MASTQAVREAGLDKFYTLPSVAKKCIDTMGQRHNWADWDLIVEPSAGNGSFFSQLPVPADKCIGIDIAPEHPGILQQDFLSFSPPNHIDTQHQRILVIGNPPFGRISSLAIKFFNHAAKWASAIAFIIPRTFRRVSVQNKLALQFHLEHDEDIPSHPCSFSPPMMAKCCFQIWVKRDHKRNVVTLPLSHPDWEFLSFGPLDSKRQPTPPEGADFALLAYGGRCGYIVQHELNILRPKTWHWIKARIDKNELIRRFTSLNYSISKDTARQNSIGRAELVKLYSDAFDD